MTEKERQKRSLIFLTIPVMEGIRRWAELGWKLGWFKKKGWDGPDEVSASIQSWIVHYDQKKYEREE